MQPPADDQQSRKLAQVRAYCQSHPGAVLYDEPGEALFDVAGVKTLALRPADLEAVEARADRDTRAPYLALTLGDGRRLALTVAGIAFAPDFRNSGPVQDLPDAVCFRDYLGLVERLKHDLYGHADEPPTRATAHLVMMCIAVLDGARQAGFNVGREERELEAHLAELEKRQPP
ncbi:MAG TPA: hypothetical protein VND93_09470 [Myxococcales bacterium]|jgi:hypothetical protein|nr:hypothetical protein [Myxococcales bacterium]